MKKRISFFIITIILISAFTISALADFNTFAFISNIQFSTQTIYPSQYTYNLSVTSSDEIVKSTSVNGGTSNMTFMGYIIDLTAFTKDPEDSTSFTDITIPIKVNIPQGASIQIPFIFCTSSTAGLTTAFKGSYCTLGSQNIDLKLSTDGTATSSMTYLDGSVTNYLNITYPNSSGFNYPNSRLLIVNIANTRDTDMYCSSFTLRYNRSLGYNDCIIFPMIYEGDDLIFYYPPNPYNIPILQEISDILELVISKLVSGDTSVADMLSSVVTLIGSLDSNIGSIDLNIVEIVEQLNYLSSISSRTSSINSTLIAIRQMLSDLTENTQNLPSQVFDQIIEDNSEYIENQKETTVNRYNDANEDKNDIYTSSSSGLTSSGGTYDYVADLVAYAGSDQGFNGIFGLIFGNSNISGIILSVIALGTISYILYGKRG